MKFKIRFADKIVGFFIILSLASLMFVIVMLGRSQRWFAKDISFHTILPSAGGLGKNMPVQYRGFTIGNVKSFSLNDNDEVEVVFSIYEEYSDRVRMGSMVEMMISPIGLGTQFFFHTGRGLPLEEGAFIPVVGSAQARELIRQGLAGDIQHDDSITLLLNRASSVLDEVNTTLVLVNEAFGTGTEETVMGNIAGSLQEIMTGAEGLPQDINQTLAAAMEMIEKINEDLTPILANINAITAEFTDEELYNQLMSSLNSMAGIFDNLDRATAFIPAQLPQIAGLIMDLRVTMKTAEDVLVALANNPLLRRGVPGRPEGESVGTSPRDIRF